MRGRGRIVYSQSKKLDTVIILIINKSVPKWQDWERSMNGLNTGYIEAPPAALQGKIFERFFGLRVEVRLG